MVNWNNKEEVKEYYRKYKKIHRETLKDYNKEYQKKYYEKNEEKMQKRDKEYYQKNEEKIRKYHKEYYQEYYQKNEKRLKERDKEYYQRNKRRKREYSKNNKERIKMKMKEYRETHKEEIKEYAKEYAKEYYKNKYNDDKQYNIRVRLGSCFNRAKEKYINENKIMISINKNINYRAIIEHLKPFPENIKNYHIDHIIPLSFFDLTNKEQLKKAWSPINLQWLKCSENIIKSDKIDFKEYPEQEMVLNKLINGRYI